MKIKLGYKPDYPAVMSAEAEERPTVYPSIYVSGEPAEKLLKKLATGDEVTAEVRLRVVGTSERENQSSIELEVQSIECETDDEARDGAEAVDRYLDKKGK